MTTARDTTLASASTGPPSIGVRLAGLAGIVGGALLLVVFVVPLEPAANTVRLALYHVGAIAVPVAAFPWLVTGGRRGVALLAVVPVVVANVVGLVLLGVSTALSIPVGPGTFGIVN